MNEAIERVEINGEKFFRQTEQDKRINQLLTEVYGRLWAEAFYDPYNKSTREFALPLYKKMYKLNTILKFKK